MSVYASGADLGGGGGGAKGAAAPPFVFLLIIIHIIHCYNFNLQAGVKIVIITIVKIITYYKP